MKQETSDNGTRRKYDEQFTQTAVKMIENGQSTRSAAAALGISEGLLHKWKAARNSNRSQLESEAIDLKARRRQVAQERDILKKALSIFSRST